jgi:hypothetical protein
LEVKVSLDCSDLQLRIASPWAWSFQDSDNPLRLSLDSKHGYHRKRITIFHRKLEIVKLSTIGHGKKKICASILGILVLRFPVVNVSPLKSAGRLITPRNQHRNHHPCTHAPIPNPTSLLLCIPQENTLSKASFFLNIRIQIAFAI